MKAYFYTEGMQLKAAHFNGRCSDLTQEERQTDKQADDHDRGLGGIASNIAHLLMYDSVIRFFAKEGIINFVS